MGVVHKFVSAKSDGPDASVVRPSNWNDTHTVTEDVSVISTDTTAVSGGTYVFTASLTLTLPPSPSAGHFVKWSDRSGTTTCVIGRNALNIMGLAENLNLDVANTSGQLTYADATRGWVLT